MPALIKDPDKKPELHELLKPLETDSNHNTPAPVAPTAPAIAPSAPGFDSVTALFGGMFDGPAAEAAPTPAPAAPAPAPAAPVSHLEEVRARSRKGSDLPNIYANNEKKLADGVHQNLTKEQEEDMKLFIERYKKNADRYEKIAHDAHIPPELVAALHWREASGQFDRYLHQGDKLGQKAHNEPTDIPLFGKGQFDQAAVHAINRFGKTRDALGLTESSTDMAAMATYSECYNGLGYYNHHHTNPYVFSGTDQYKGGKYVKDHKYNPDVKDEQLGVVAMIDALHHDPDLQKRLAEKQAKQGPQHN